MTNPLKNIVAKRVFEAGEFPKNPPAAFILNPPRSGSSLLRAMLAGHPSLFAPAELGLLGQHGTNPDSGPVNGVMYPAKRAIELLERFDVDPFVGPGYNTQEVYRILQERSARFLIDKTPYYAINPDILARAEDIFDGPRYIWLVRHPAGVTKSWSELEDNFFWGWRVSKLGLSKARIGELTWRLCHENIEAFLANIPESRKHVVKYEQFISDTRSTMNGICDFLGVTPHEKMMDPYDGDGERMIDRYGTDPNFFIRSKIEPGLIDSWKGVIDPSTFDEETKALARRLGYDV